jgi:OOP family OmpA-OmpF porin
MKSNKLIILFLFVVNSVFSQEKIAALISADSIETTKDSLGTNVDNRKWSVEVGSGISNGTMPYTNGYYTSIDNQLFKGIVFNTYSLGASYQFSEIVGLKMDMAFDRFINSPETKSEPFEAGQYRASVQTVFNLNSFFKPFNSGARSNVLLHAGLNIALMSPIKGDYDKVVSNNDIYGGIVFGITPTLKLSNKVSIFVDASYFNNYDQSLTWNGKDAADNDEANMYSVTFGLSFALGGSKKNE